MRLSIADFFTLPSQSVKLASLADEAGFARYWVGEHHTPTQCANPLLLASVLAGMTETIRIGTGAMLLGSRSAISLAEDARLVTQLYGDRLDLGVTSGWTDTLPATCTELVTLLHPDLDPARRMPYTEDAPALWLMASRAEAATLAAKLGLGLCTSFHHGGTREGIRDLVARYRDGFQPGSLSEPRAIAMLSGICGEDRAALAEARTSFGAARVALGGTGAPRQTVAFDGLPDQVADLAQREAAEVEVDEIMLLFLETRIDAADRLAPVLAALASGLR